MKRVMIATLAVLFACVALCTWGMIALNGVLDEAHAATIDIFVQMEQGRVEAAREGLVGLANLWEEHAFMLETLCDHEDVHTVKERIIQAQICMEYTDMEDFFSSISLIGEGIEHIRDEEALRISNLY